MAFEPAGEFEFEQYCPDVPRRRLGRAHDFIDRHRRRPSSSMTRAAIFSREAAGRRPAAVARHRRHPIVVVGRSISAAPSASSAAVRFPTAAPTNTAVEFRQVEFRQFELVPEGRIGPRRQVRLGETEAFVGENFWRASASSTSSALVQNVAPSRKRSLAPSARGSSGEPGHGEDFATLIGGEAGGDERTRAAGGLDDHDPAREPCDNTIAAWEISAPRLPAEWHFADRRATLDEPLQQPLVVGRINIAEAAGEDRNGAGLEGGLMRPRIDAARQPRDDDMAGPREGARNLLGESKARRRRIARADHRDFRSAQACKVAANGDQRGGAWMCRSSAG